MLIKKVQRLKDQGPHGSPAYEFATKIARAKDELAMETVMVGNTSVPYKSACRYVKYKKPPLGPPLDPLKYGTPRRLLLGDAACSPS